LIHNLSASQASAAGLTGYGMAGDEFLTCYSSSFRCIRHYHFPSLGPV
jgi:hypothetical protein